MIFVLLSVLCSVLVSVLLKLARRLQIDVGQAIAWNYVVTSVLTAWLLQPTLTTLRGPGVPWLALVALGILLPTIFLALAAAVRHAGIVRSDAAQPLSLPGPVANSGTGRGEPAQRLRRRPWPLVPSGSSASSSTRSSWPASRSA